MTEMGGFIFKLKLTDVDQLELLDKRGYLTVCLSTAKEGKIYLRRPEGIREWFAAIQVSEREMLRRHGVVYIKKIAFLVAVAVDSSYGCS